MNALSRLKVQITSTLFLLSSFCPLGQATASLTIPQIPLITASPIHPQVLIVIPNSESMDGTLSGAIMTGSGGLSSSYSSLTNSSSPTTYSVPSGFTPPLQAADGSGNAPYTVTVSSTQYDNGPSRLNVAKAGVKAIIQQYMASTDFGLATYSVSGASLYNTWVYHMSAAGSGFTFTSTPVAGKRYVNNPCYQYTTASTQVRSDCTSLATYYGGASNIATSKYMLIGATSDDPNINDVFYSTSGFTGTFVTYGGPSPASPFPPNFSLGNYNSGSVLLRYSFSVPNIGSLGAGPTNAGYVPFSREVMESQRGWGYLGSQSANTGRILVSMTTAGTTPTVTSVNNAINTFTPYLAPETNNSGTSEIKSAAVQAPIAGLLKQANTYMNPLATTSGNGCPQKKYVILISDGLPTQDLNGNLWPPLGTDSATGYVVTATFNADGSLNTTNDQALTDTISSIRTLKTNGIATYVIGLGAGVDPTLNPQAAASLTAMAIAGGTTNYYPATSPAALVNDLNTILISIQNGSYDASAAAVSSTHLNSNTAEYQASFTSSDTPYQDWTGNLQAIQLDSYGVPSSSTLWSARPLLDTLVSGTGWSTNRIVTTWNPVMNDGVPFRWANISTAQQSQLQPTDLLGSNRVDYIRGNASLEVRNGGAFRNRSHILADLVDSQVMYVGAPNNVYLSSSYVSFATSNKTRSPMLYVGGNDGMLHAFSASTGVELFAFIPNGVFSNLVNLTSTVYNQSHLFFVDGSPQSDDVQFSDGNWHTVLIGGENAGGKSIYALDVTNPGGLTTESSVANAILWEFTETDMGLSYSQPQIAEIGSSSSSPVTFAAFFGNGYNSTSNKAILYAVNPQTGALIKKIDLCAAVSGSCNSTLPQGLSSVTVANKDGLQGQPITNVYAGDLQGNLWSVNVSDVNPDNWSVRLLFTAKDSLGNIQPITTPPVASLHPNYPRKQGVFLIFGTGRLLVSGDLLDTSTQTVYGVWDKQATSSTYARANLQQQTITYVSKASSGLAFDILTTTANTVNWDTQYGWYTDLPIAGQRLITTPDLVNGAFIATINTPPLSLCGTGFTSMLLETNYSNGGTFTSPQLDLNADGALTSTDVYNAKYAVGRGLSSSYASSPNVLGTNANGKMVILITQSNGSQSTVINNNNTPRKVGWWEIQ